MIDTTAFFSLHKLLVMSLFETTLFLHYDFIIFRAKKSNTSNKLLKHLNEKMR